MLSAVSNFIRSERGLLFLFCLGAFSILVGLWFNSIYLLLFLILLIHAKVHRYISWTFMWLFVFSLSYAFIGYNNYLMGWGPVVFFLCYPCGFYLLGAYWSNKWHYSEHTILLILFIIAITLAIPYYIIALNDGLITGFINYDRNILNIETGDNLIATTLTVAGVSLTLSGIGLLFCPARDLFERRYKKLFLFFSLLSLFVVIHFLSRTGLVVFMACLIMGLLYSLKGYSRSAIIVVIAILSIGGYLVYNIFEDYFAMTEIVEAYADREIEGSSIRDAGGRVERWQYGWEHISTNPMGNVRKPNGDRFFAHNFWLDAAKTSGAIPFISLLFASLLSYRHLYVLLRKGNLPNMLAVTLITLNVSFFLTCFVEPILEGIMLYAFMYFMLWGIQDGLLRQIKCKKKVFSHR